MENAEEIHKVMDTALAAIEEIYKDQAISDVEVEEIEQEPATLERERGDWLITVGFNIDKPRSVLGNLVMSPRTLKVIRVDPSGKFKSMKNREPVT